MDRISELELERLVYVSVLVPDHKILVRVVVVIASERIFRLTGCNCPFTRLHHPDHVIFAKRCTGGTNVQKRPCIELLN